MRGPRTPQSFLGPGGNSSQGMSLQIRPPTVSTWDHAGNTGVKFQQVAVEGQPLLYQQQQWLMDSQPQLTLKIP